MKKGEREGDQGMQLELSGRSLKISQVLTFDLLVRPRGRDLSIISISFSLTHTHTLLSRAHTCTQTHIHIPAGEASDWAMSAAMAELGFNLLPNMWEGARLKMDPGKPLT